jgi:hypothetical protein
MSAQLKGFVVNTAEIVNFVTQGLVEAQVSGWNFEFGLFGRSQSKN